MADAVLVNAEEGMQRVLNNAKLYVRLLTKFRNDTSLDEITAAIEAGDTEKAKNDVHTLKGLAANLSLTELFKQVLELETQLKAGNPGAEQLLTVKAVFADTITEIDKVVEKYA